MFTILEERKKHGFTLIEIIVVVGIMSVLSAVLIPAVIHYAEDSRVQRDDAAMAEITNMTKTIMDSNIEAYDELYSIGQYIAAGDAGVYIVWKDMGETEGFVPYVLGERLEDMAPTFYTELYKTLEGPVFMQSGSYQRQYFVVTLQKDDDDELRWVSGGWSETETRNITTGAYTPVDPVIPNIPDTPFIPEDIGDVTPEDPYKNEENNPISQPEDEVSVLPEATWNEQPQGKNLSWTGSMQELIIPGTTTQGTFYYKLSSSGSNLWQTGVPKAQNVGDYQVSWYIKGAEGFKDSQVKMVTARIEPGTPNHTPPVGSDVTYTGQWEPLIEVMGTGIPADKVQIVYSLDKTTWDPNPPARQAVGNYIVYYKLITSDEMMQDNTIYSVNAYIRPWEGNYAMPTATNPTYTGSAQALLNPGTAPDGCTIYYRTDETGWDTKIPKQTNAGTYTVYYKIDGGDRYSSVGETPVPCTIKKATPTLGLSSVRTIFTPPTTKTTITINNNSDGAVTVASTQDGVVKPTLSTDRKSFSLQAYNQGSATVTVSVSETNNFLAASVEHLVEVTVGTITATSQDGKATYNGQPQDGGAKVFVTTPASGYTIQYREYGTGTWQGSMPQYTNAGTYTVEYSISAEGFTPKTGTFTIIIEKAKATSSQMPSVTGYEWIYNGSEYKPVINNPTNTSGSPTWQLTSATVNYSTYDGYAVNDKLTSMPSITEPGELRLSNFVFNDRTGNYEDVTLDAFLLNSRIDGTSTAMSTLMMKCYTAEGDESVYYRTNNGVLYLRKTYRDGYTMASLNTAPAYNMFLDQNTAGITRIHIETPILPVSMAHWFSDIPNLQEITFNVIDGEAVQIDTRFTTSMEGLFKNSGIQVDRDGSVLGLDFGKWNTTSVTNFSDMFAGCSKLTSIDVSSLNTVNATNMSGMFSNCSTLTNITFGSFVTANVTSYNGMFQDSPQLKNLDMRSFDVSANASMDNMFDGASRLETVTFGPGFKWNTADGHLPAQSSQLVTAADGRWYDITDASAYSPEQLATRVSASSATQTYSSVPYYWLDIINGMRDGIKSDTIEGLANVDVYINDQLMMEDAVDWYHPYRYGTKYAFKNMQLTSNLGFTGIHNSNFSLSGTLTGTMVSWLKFETIAGEFQYTGGYQTFTAPVAGYYTIEAWGAQGGKSIADGKILDTGLAGGYAKGNLYLDAGQTIYIAVGGKGANPVSQKDSAGGWNGGGSSTWDHSTEGSSSEVAGSGGGATSVQLSLIGDGQLSNYANKKDQVVLVAGGGGGSGWENSTYGGVGGGVQGGTASTDGPAVATQDSGYAFGVGESGVWNTSWGANKYSNGIPGAGGGWYGGRIKIGTYASSGGGSGYIGGLAHGEMDSGINKGDGLVKISYSGTEEHSNPTSQSFAFTGSVQEFVVPISGYYKLEAWGAAGGIGRGETLPYGKGGYTSGITYLTKGTILYVYVGEYGINQYQNVVAFNGGGSAYDFTGTNNDHVGGRGGGATDFRLQGGAWDSTNGLKSRILVAGGGGGAQSTCGTTATAGHGGGLVAVTSYNMGYQKRAQDVARTRAYATGGSQTSAGVGYNINDNSSNQTNGSFGKGANSKKCASGGGGGWYGGGSAYTAGGGGGSSYITRYPGCDTTYLDYQGNYTFTHTTIAAGLNEGNGKAKITYMGDNVSNDTVELIIEHSGTNVADLGQFDLYIDNMLLGTQISSYRGEIPAGTPWEMCNFKTTWTMNGATQTWNYLCAERQGLSGTIQEDGHVKLQWMYSGSITDFGTISDGNAVAANQEVLWTLNGGTLSIYPRNNATGIIQNLTSSPSWKDKRTSITTVKTSGTLTTSEYFTHVFENCTALTSVDLKAINVNNAKDVSYCFRGCTKLTAFNGFSGSAYIRNYNNMFEGCIAITAIDISSLNALDNATMHYMFKDIPAAKLNQIKTPTYFYFGNSSAFPFSSSYKWKHSSMSAGVTAEQFQSYVTDPNYAGLWTRV